MNGDLEMPFPGAKCELGNAPPPGDPIPGLRENNAPPEGGFLAPSASPDGRIRRSHNEKTSCPPSSTTTPNTTGFSRFPPEVAGGFSPRRKADAGPFSGGAYFPANEKQTPSLPAVENAGANKHSLSNGRVASRHGIAGTREVLATPLRPGIQSPGCVREAPPQGGSFAESGTPAENSRRSYNQNRVCASTRKVHPQAQPTSAGFHLR